jgi:alkylation response protein AidB-like acyl-CoA dehydrogenase
MRHHVFDPDPEDVRAAGRECLHREVAPHQDRWEKEGDADPQLWLAAGRQGLLGLAFPKHLGGGGMGDYRFRFVMIEELARIGAASINAYVSLLEDLAGPYLLDLADADQQKRWLPLLCAGETTVALAMTEPGAGSDLRGIATSARRDGDGWVLRGSKTFITNGARADVVVVVARTDPAGGRDGFSLFVVERDMPGFGSGASLDKLGQRGQNVSELYFDDVRVGEGHLIGELGGGLRHLRERLPTERMSIACYALSAAETVLAETTAYVAGRSTFGQALGDFQHVRFELAEMATEVDVTRSFVQDAVRALNAGELSATDAAKAKWWASELQKRVADRCLQLHGGYGYARESSIARAFVDARVQTIYGGATEIMKDLIGRDLMRRAREHGRDHPAADPGPGAGRRGIR